MSETLLLRPEIIKPETTAGDVQVEASLSWFERIYGIGAVRKAFILLVLVLVFKPTGLLGERMEEKI